MIFEKLFVAGHPVPQPRARVARIGGKMVAYTPGKSIKVWRHTLALQVRAGITARWLRAPVLVSFGFRICRSLSQFQGEYHGGPLRADAPVHMEYKPDLDNLTKAVMDVMTEEDIWLDDCHVTNQSATKEWVTMPELEGVQIMLGYMENGKAPVKQ